MELLSVCPLLIAQNREATHYHGFITAKGEDFEIGINLAPGRRLKGAHVSCSWKMQNLLKGYEQLLQQRLEQSRTLAGFLVELKSILERQLEQCSRLTVPPPMQYYDQLLQQIESLGWHRLIYIDGEFQELHLEVKDRTSRSHILKVHLAPKHPVEPPKCLVDLPGRFDFIWSEKTSTLGELYSQFEKCVEQYQEFWDIMDEIDAHTWVLEPEKPTRSATTRRIALGSSASVQVEVDSAHPRMLPECRFLGADHVVNPLKENLTANLDKWNAGTSLYHNLQTVLVIEFPSPATTSKEEFSVECGICYAYRLENLIPDQVCSDERCGQPFHQACLYEWLKALPSSRQSFNTLFGECPYCSKAITVKMPT